MERKKQSLEEEDEEKSGTAVQKERKQEWNISFVCLFPLCHVLLPLILCHRRSHHVGKGSPPHSAVLIASWGAGLCGEEWWADQSSSLHTGTWLSSQMVSGSSSRKGGCDTQLHTVVWWCHRKGPRFGLVSHLVSSSTSEDMLIHLETYLYTNISAVLCAWGLSLHDHCCALVSHLEGAHQGLIHAHHAAGVVELAAVVGSREQSYQLSLGEELVTVFHHLGAWDTALRVRGGDAFKKTRGSKLHLFAF